MIERSPSAAVGERSRPRDGLCVQCQWNGATSIDYEGHTSRCALDIALYEQTLSIGPATGFVYRLSQLSTLGCQGNTAAASAPSRLDHNGIPECARGFTRVTSRTQNDRARMRNTALPECPGQPCLVRCLANHLRARTKNRRADPLDAGRQPLEAPIAFRRDQPDGINGGNELVRQRSFAGFASLAGIGAYDADAGRNAQPKPCIRRGDDLVTTDCREVCHQRADHRRALAGKRGWHRPTSKAAAARELVNENPSTPSSTAHGLATTGEQRVKMEVMFPELATIVASGNSDHSRKAGSVDSHAQRVLDCGT